MLDGEDGDDRWLSGGAGNDTIRGGLGDDRISGDILLDGGAENDTYYFNSLTDGNDTIEDSDATGTIWVNGHVLTGGIKKAGDPNWVSPDRQFQYRLEGGH